MATTTKPADTRTDTDRNATGSTVSASDIAAIHDALGTISTKLDKQQRTLDKHTQQLKGIRSKQTDTDNSLLLTKAQNQLIAMGIYVALLALLYFVQAIKNAAADMPGWLQKAMGVEAIASAPGQLLPGTAGLSNEQLDNAEAIIAAGRSVDGITDRDIQIALMTALQESSMKNLAHGDNWWFAQWGETSDSRGLFQQRASWGTEECRMKPECSAKLFYEALLEVPNREAMGLGEVAQSVQSSAFPGEYSKWESKAKELLDASSGNAIALSSGNVLDLPQPLAHNQMVPGGKVSSLYGDRLLNGVPDFHAGLDIAAPEGTPILAPIDLCIKSAIPDGDGSGFGNYLIATPKGRDDVELIFGHNFKNIAVSGQCYDQGEVIAEVGNTGNSFGAHLHIEITDLSGKSSPDGNMPWDVDPAPWFGVTGVEWEK